MMDFNTKFILEMFLDDSTSTVNRLIVATANVASENLENLEKLNVYEHKYIPQSIRRKYDKERRNSKEIKEKFDYYKYLRRYFTDNDYINNFKMKINTIKELIKYLNTFVAEEEISKVPFDKKVHIFLYAFTSDLSFNKVAEKFGLHKSSVSCIFYEIATLISEKRFHFINWPSPVEQHLTRMKVNSRYGFPNCVGFIDACRLRIGSKRKCNQNSDVILLQAVCDESFMLTDIHVGDIGNTKKSKVFKESLLAKHLKDYIDHENHILGDSSYKLRDNLITPFVSDTLSNEEIKFNEILMTSHKHIGITLKMLKDRFKKINNIDVCKPQAIKTVIHAACVLHNFILIHEGHSQLKEGNNLNNYSLTIDTNIVTSAEEKRQFLCNYMASFTPNVLSSTESEHAYCQRNDVEM